MRFRNLREAIKASLKGSSLVLTAAGGFLAYILLVIFSFPAYMYQLLGRSLLYFPSVLRMSTLSVLDTAGVLGLILTTLYAGLTGILLTNIYLRFRINSFSGMTDLGAFLPGLLVSGCASCGVGLLTILGFSGIVAALPFSGNLVLGAGILLMAGLLQRSGDPRKCSIPSS